MRAILVMAALLVATLPTLADEAKARAALAITAPIPAPIVKAKAPCDCANTGSCKCNPADCECCKGGVPQYADQVEKAKASGQVLVLYAGCDGSCIDGCLSGTQAGDKAEIIVGYMKQNAAGGWASYQAATLTPRATKSEIEEAIAKAKWDRDHGKWTWVKDNPFCTLNCTVKAQWVPDPLPQKGT